VKLPTASFCLLANPSADGVGHLREKKKTYEQRHMTDNYLLNQTLAYLKMDAFLPSGKRRLYPHSETMGY